MQVFVHYELRQQSLRRFVCSEMSCNGSVFKLIEVMVEVRSCCAPKVVVVVDFSAVLV